MNYKSIAEIPETDLTMEQALAAMDALHPEAYARYSWMKLRRLLSIAAQGHHTPVFDDTPAFPMIRGRSVKVRQFGQDEFPKKTALITAVDELGPRRSEEVNSYGRCHVPNSPIFYASFNEDTVLAELSPERDSLVYFLTCVPKPHVVFKTRLIGEIDYIRRHGKSSVLSMANLQVREIKSWLSNAKSEKDYVRIVTDAFLANLFLQKAVTQDDYKATSALCALMLELDVDNAGAGEALYYPSIANRGGMNIALTRKCYAEKVVPVSCKVVLVEGYFGYGIYKTHTLTTSESIDDAGQISWRPTACD